MAEIRLLTVFERLELPPAGAGTWFVNNVMQDAVRSFTAVPINPLIDEIYGPDQIVEVTHTYHLLKGSNHETDGTGGTGEMQAYVTIQNRDPNNAATFNVMMSEIF
jgi:hypothetical protein